MGKPPRHGHCVIKKSPTYDSWRSMRARCSKPDREGAERYIERGIKVCERWETFENFLEDMGERPEGTTIDRWPDANGNYEPGNCRWATKKEQARNRRTSKLTFEDAVQVAILRLSGVSGALIAKQYGINNALPSQITRSLCWPDALIEAKKRMEKKDD